MKISLSLPASLFAGVFLALFLTAPALAQQPPGRVGIGGQIGSPSGLTLKMYQHPGFAYDFLAAWDFDNFFLFSIHGLYERAVPDSPLRFFYGPGAVISIRDRPAADNEVALGISGNFGINFFMEQFEVYLQVTPRLDVVPATRGRIGGGVGLRYYF
jgi:hypothetical protein